jgi:transposase
VNGHQWGPVAQVARELGLNEGTLGNWVNTWRKKHAHEEAPLTVPERARLHELEREVSKLRMHNEFLKKVCQEQVRLPEAGS